MPPPCAGWVEAFPIRTADDIECTFAAAMGKTVREILASNKELAAKLLLFSNLPKLAGINMLA